MTADLAQALLDAAAKAGADSADALVIAGTSLSIDVREGRLEHAERADGVEIIGIAQQVHRHDRPRAVRDGLGQRRKIVIQRITVDIDEFQVQPVLMQRKIGRRPGYGGHDHLMARLQPQIGIAAVAQRRGHQQIGR